MVPPSVASYRAMVRALDSYLAKARRVRGMTVPPPEHAFWQLYERIAAIVVGWVSDHCA